MSSDFQGKDNIGSANNDVFGCIGGLYKLFIHSVLLTVDCGWYAPSLEKKFGVPAQTLSETAMNVFLPPKKDPPKKNAICCI